MTKDEMQLILGELLRRESMDLDLPTLADWNELEAELGCTLDDDFKQFIGLMSQYQFPGDILNVSSGRTNGNDSILVAYHLESDLPSWQPRMIPFYAIGNGDYFCLNKIECPDSGVYYYDHDRSDFELYCSSFAHWIRQLPQFLS